MVEARGLEPLTFPASPWTLSRSVGSRGFVVEARGLEPLTSCMPCKRSPS